MQQNDLLKKMEECVVEHKNLGVSFDDTMEMAKYINNHSIPILTVDTSWVGVKGYKISRYGWVNRSSRGGYRVDERGNSLGRKKEGPKSVILLSIEKELYDKIKEKNESPQNYLRELIKKDLLEN